MRQLNLTETSKLIGYDRRILLADGASPAMQELAETMGRLDTLAVVGNTATQLSREKNHSRGVDFTLGEPADPFTVVSVVRERAHRAIIIPGVSSLGALILGARDVIYEQGGGTPVVLFEQPGQNFLAIDPIEKPNINAILSANRTDRP